MNAKQNRTNSAKEAALADVKAEQMKRLNANVAESKYRALKVEAAKEGKEISELVNTWIDEYLSKHSK